MTGLITPALEGFLAFGLGPQLSLTILNMDPFNSIESELDGMLG